MFFSEYILGKLASNISYLYNSAENKRCHIYGTGPTLLNVDISKYHNVPSFFVNALILHKQFSSVENKYFVLMQPRVFYKSFTPSHQHQLFDLIKLSLNGSDNVFLHSMHRPLFAGRKFNFLYKNIPDPRLPFFSCNDFLTGSFTAPIALAIYMGFQEIFLFGFDSHVSQYSLNKRCWENDLNLLNLSFHSSSLDPLFLKLSKFAKIFPIVADESYPKYDNSIFISDFTIDKEAVQFTNLDIFDEFVIHSLYKSQPNI